MNEGRGYQLTIDDFDAWCLAVTALLQRWIQQEGLTEEKALERFWGKELIQAWKHLYDEE